MSAERSAQISIIVPVYKVEPYLRCCIDSILAQTFRDFELILVDDGSPDNCGAICEEYAAKDDRVVVIHQENRGVSAARNTALDWVFANSDSQWITFVDSDDIIVPTCLELLLEQALATEADIITAHVYSFENNEDPVGDSTKVEVYRSMDGRTACLSFYRDEGIVLPFACGKMCRKEMLADIRFPEGVSYAEDEHLVVRLMYSAKRVTILTTQLYGYRRHNASANHRPFSDWAIGFAEVIDSSAAFFEAKDEREIVVLAKKKLTEIRAKNMLMAYGAGKLDMVPENYRMPLWRAFMITMAYTLRRGGMKYIFVRLRIFWERIKH